MASDLENAWIVFLMNGWRQAYPISLSSNPMCMLDGDSECLLCLRLGRKHPAGSTVCWKRFGHGPVNATLSSLLSSVNLNQYLSLILQLGDWTRAEGTDMSLLLLAQTFWQFNINPLHGDMAVTRWCSVALNLPTVSHECRAGHGRSKSLVGNYKIVNLLLYRENYFPGFESLKKM